MNPELPQKPIKGDMQKLYEAMERTRSYSIEELKELAQSLGMQAYVASNLMGPKKNPKGYLLEDSAGDRYWRSDRIYTEPGEVEDSFLEGMKLDQRVMMIRNTLEQQQNRNAEIDRQVQDLMAEKATRTAEIEKLNQLLEAAKQIARFPSVA